MSAFLFSALAATVFATSLLSGVFGMAGGMVLMVFLLAVMPVPVAIGLHSTIQMVSNGWRCFLWRRHIVWRVLPWYLAGIALGFTVMLVLRFVPDRGTALIVMGSLPLLSIALERKMILSIMNRAHAFFAATLLTFMHMTAGIIGPLLDMLYNNAPLTRQEIISTKAFTQTVMHILRAGYFGLLVSSVTGQGWNDFLNPWLLPVLLVVSVAGTSAAAIIVRRMDDARFKRYSRILIVGISLYALFEGLQEKFKIFPL